MSSRSTIVVIVSVLAGVLAWISIGSTPGSPEPVGPSDPLPSAGGHSGGGEPDRPVVVHAPAAPAEASLLIRGVAIDAAAGLPVANATAHLGPGLGTDVWVTVSCGTDGVFEIEFPHLEKATLDGAPIAVWALDVERRLRSVPIVRTTEQLREGDALLLRMERVTEVSGRVVDARGSPCPRAIVRIDEKPGSPQADWDYGRLFTRRQSLVTDDAGRFRALVRIGALHAWARASHGAFSEVVATVVGAESSQTELGDIRLPSESRRITVRLVDADGRPVAGAGLSLEYDEYVATEPHTVAPGPWHARSASDGAIELRFRGSAGPLVMAASCAGYETVRLCIEELPGDGKVIELPLRRRPGLEVRFHGPNAGSAADEAEVLLRPVATPAAPGNVFTVPDGAPVRESVTDEITPAERAVLITDGLSPHRRSGDRIDVSIPAPGRYAVTVILPGLGEFQDVVTLADWGERVVVDVPLIPATWRSVSLEDAWWEAFPDVEEVSVHVQPAESGGDVPPPPQRVASGSPPREATLREWTCGWTLVRLTRRAGRSVLIPDGATRVVSQSFRYERWPIGEAQWLGDDLVVHPGDRTGHLLTVAVHREGAPLPAAGLVVRAEGRLSGDGLRPRVVARTAIGPDGTATMRLPAGSYRVALDPTSGGGATKAVDLAGPASIVLRESESAE